MKILLIDWSMLCVQARFSILSQATAHSSETEIDAVARKITELLFTIHHREKCDRTLIAMDHGPYWRKAWLDEHYAQYAEYAKDETTQYFRFDNVIHALPIGENQWPADRRKVKKLSVKEMDDVDLLAWTQVPKELHHLLPSYKGNRDRNAWVFQASKEEYTLLHKKMAVELAHLVNARVADVKGMEADDIAGVISQARIEGNDITFVTGDSDWHQVLQPGDKMISLITGEYVNKTPEEIERDLHRKFISGDSGDGISGTHKGNKGCWGAKSKAIEAQLDKENWAEGIDPETLYKNRTLITLPCPSWKSDKAKKAIMASMTAELVVTIKHEGSWADYGLTQKMQDSMKVDGAVEQFFANLRLKTFKEAGQ